MDAGINLSFRFDLAKFCPLWPLRRSLCAEAPGVSGSAAEPDTARRGYPGVRQRARRPKLSGSHPDSGGRCSGPAAGDHTVVQVGPRTPLGDREIASPDEILLPGAMVILTGPAGALRCHQRGRSHVRVGQTAQVARFGQFDLFPIAGRSGRGRGPRLAALPFTELSHASTVSGHRIRWGLGSRDADMNPQTDRETSLRPPGRAIERCR